MENRPITPEPGSVTITGSKRGDRWLGIGIAIAWWVGGSILLHASERNSGGIFLGILFAYLGQIVYLNRKPGGGTLAWSIFVATGIVPVIALLGFFGMCSLGIVKVQF